MVNIAIFLFSAHTITLICNIVITADIKNYYSDKNIGYPINVYIMVVVFSILLLIITIICCKKRGQEQIYISYTFMVIFCINTIVQVFFAETFMDEGINQCHIRENFKSKCYDLRNINIICFISALLVLLNFVINFMLFFLISCGLHLKKTIYYVSELEKDQYFEDEFFHGTSEKNAYGIINDGFNISQKGICGKGVYLTRNYEKAKGFSRKYDVPAIIKVFVKKGTIVNLDIHQFMQETWQDFFDIAYIPNNSLTRTEEHCVRNPELLTVLDIEFNP